MKITMEIDCSPEEARRFLGLPDVSELHAEVTQQMNETMINAAKSFDANTLMKAWMPLGNEAMGAEGMAAMQKAFWQGLMDTKPSSSK